LADNGALKAVGKAFILLSGFYAYGGLELFHWDV
jgi:hypothetical protein